MKANELRIGNLVFDNGVDYDPEGNKYHDTSGDEVVRVLSISYDSLIGPDPNHYLINRSEQNNFSPIPLTEEWLLKFGFYRHYGSFQKAITNGFINISIEHKSAFISNGDEPLHYLPFPEYVHLLQNAWPALTSQELTIKE